MVALNRVVVFLLASTVLLVHLAVISQRSRNFVLEEGGDDQEGVVEEEPKMGWGSSTRWIRAGARLETPHNAAPYRGNYPDPIQIIGHLDPYTDFPRANHRGLPSIPRQYMNKKIGDPEVYDDDDEPIFSSNQASSDDDNADCDERSLVQ